MSYDNLHPIKAVAKRTGLSAYTIRAWEKRYHAVVPQRSQTRRRLYTDNDIQKLILLRLATEAGYRIGQIADYSIDRLKDLLEDVRHIIPREIGPEELSIGDDSSGYLEKCLKAMVSYDNVGFEEILDEALIELGEVALIDRLIVPLLDKIGDLWQRGTIRAAQEHLASAVIRTFVGNLLSRQESRANAPHITVTTPSGQVHENGALVAAAVAASDGWNVTYLGPNLGAEEIAGAVRKKNSRVVALSIIYPSDDPDVAIELEKIRKFLGNDVSIIIGGRSADSYKEILNSIRAIYVEDLTDLRTILREIRTDFISKSE